MDCADAVRASDAVFICVRAPPLESGEADLPAIDNVARQFASEAQSPGLVIEKSTAPASAGEQLQRTLAGRNSGVRFRVASNSEFLREGTTVSYFLHPDQIVVGVIDGESVLALRWLCLLPFFRSFQLSAGDAVTAAGHQPLRLGSQTAAAAFNFGVNLYLIPRYSWRGAAWSSLATDGMLALFNWAVLLWLTSDNGVQNTLEAIS